MSDLEPGASVPGLKSQRLKRMRENVSRVYNPNEVGGDHDGPSGSPKRAKDQTATSGQASESRPEVWIWDLDETLVIFLSLVSGKFASDFGVDFQESKAVGSMMAEVVFDVLDHHFFFAEVEDYDQTCVTDLDALHDDDIDLNSYDFKNDGLVDSGNCDYVKLACRYAVMKKLYQSGSTSEFLSGERLEGAQTMLRKVDEFTAGWLSTARSVVQELQAKRTPRANHYLVSNGQLTATLGKMVLCNFSDLFPVENVFSSRAYGKFDTFKGIQSSHPDARFVCVGDGPEEKKAAMNLAMDFFEIRSLEDLKKLLAVP